MRATSTERMFLRKSKGISLRKTGVKSARPELTASRQLAPMKKLFDLKCSEGFEDFRK